MSVYLCVRARACINGRYRLGVSLIDVVINGSDYVCIFVCARARACTNATKSVGDVMI